MVNACYGLISSQIIFLAAHDQRLEEEQSRLEGECARVGFFEESCPTLRDRMFENAHFAAQQEISLARLVGMICLRSIATGNVHRLEQLHEAVWRANASYRRLVKSSIVARPLDSEMDSWMEQRPLLRKRRAVDPNIL